MVAVTKSLPKLGLGMAALGRPGYINLERGNVFDSSDANTDDVRRRSVESMQEKANNAMATLMAESKANNMLPWYDCARSYGLSEKFVGEFLRGNNVKPGEVVVSSKWGYTYVADWKVKLESGAPHEVKDHSIENFLKQVEETKANIGEYLSIYQVHSATFESGILTDSRVHEALASCKIETGWKIGLSVSGPTQGKILQEAMKITSPDGTRLFDSVQCTYNLFEQRPDSALLDAHNAGMDIIIKEGMANGRILQNEKVQDIATKCGFAKDQLALACILAQPFQPRVLSGAVTPEQVSSNAKAIDLSERLKSDKKDLLNDIMKECVIESEQYWKDRSALAWN
jgi:aryl-alcohol dehydrogenase-like predicted oxidoreductase